MRRFILLPAIIILSLVFAGIATADTLISNGGYEEGDLSDWTCASCSAETGAAFAGDYLARRDADQTLSQAVTVPATCDTWQLVYAAREYQAGDHTITAGFDDCGQTSTDYTPALPGEAWSTHYLYVDSCSGDTTFNIAFSGDGATDLDEVALYCLSGGGGGPDPYEGTTGNGTTYWLSPSATFGDLALFLPLSAIAALLGLNTAIQLIMYRHTRR